MNFAFITRHQPTPVQNKLAAEQDITLHSIGNADPFTVDVVSFVREASKRLDVIFDGVVINHPVAALRLCGTFMIGVFEDTNLAPEGSPWRKDEAIKALHVYSMYAQIYTVEA